MYSTMIGNSIVYLALEREARVLGGMNLTNCRLRQVTRIIGHATLFPRGKRATVPVIILWIWFRNDCERGNICSIQIPTFAVFHHVSPQLQSASLHT